MKILHIISSLGAGGAEVYVRDLSVQMERLGHEVCIVYISSAISTNNSMEFERQFKSILDDAGCKYKEIGYDCRRKFWLGAYRLRQIILEFQPDVIHSHLYYGLIFIALCYVNIPVLYTHHTKYVHNKRLFFLFNKIVDQYIGISKDCSKSLDIASSRKSLTIYNGVSYDRIFIKNTAKINDDKLSIISVGRLWKAKNYPLMISGIQLFINIYQSKKNIILKIVGEGPEAKTIQQQINNSGLQEKVLLLGNRKDVGQLLHDADIFLMSSDTEGLPISLLEALMTGLPAIVTDVGSCREVIETCEAGVVVPPKNAEAIAEALNVMVSNTAKRIKWSENAKRNAEKFDIFSSVSAHLDIYRSLCQNQDEYR